jgi:glyoxylase-like metal-dependent hydrolase (beta-lactamase superfamily II)
LKAHYESEGLKIPIYIHSADSGYLGKEGRERHLRDINTLGAEYHSLFHSFLENLPDYDFLLEENDRILDTDLTVLHTPGHTPGSISIYSESDFILFSGDTLFFEGIGRTDLPGGNMEQLLTSIREKLYVLPEDTRVFPGHGPYTSIEREKSHNPFV